MRILWIPHTGWHIPQRAHLFCRALSERHEVHVTDWVADFSSVKDIFSKRYLKNYTYRYRRDGNIHVHGIPRVSPALFSKKLRLINQKIFSRYVQQIIDRYEIDVVVGTFVVPPPQAPTLVLDVFDDNPAYWREFRSNPAMADEIAEMELAWATASDRIVVISSVLQEKLTKQLGKDIQQKIEIIPNGVDLQRFVVADRRRVRDQLNIGDKKVVGFISGLGEFSGLMRYMESVRHLDRPDVIHLVVGDGALLPTARQFVSVHGLTNVRFTGWVKAEEVVDYFAALDVGVIPFDLANFTHSSFPIKLLEYLACNIPVVSTPLEEVKRLDLTGVLLAGPDSASFATGIEQALNMQTPISQDLTRYDVSYLVGQYEAILEGR